MSHIALDSEQAACGDHERGVPLSDGISCPCCIAIMDGIGRSLSLAFPTRLPNGAIYGDPYMEEDELRGAFNSIEKVIAKKRAEGTLPPPCTP